MFTEPVHKLNPVGLPLFKGFLSYFLQQEALRPASLSWYEGGGKPLKENRGERRFHAACGANDVFY